MLLIIDIQFINPDVYTLFLDSLSFKISSFQFANLESSLFQVFTVLKAQRRLSCVLQTLSEASQQVPAYRPAYPAHLSIGVNLV